MRTRLCVWFRTKLQRVHLLHGVDGGQVGDAALDAGASVAGHLVHALNHLLLPVDPVQVLPQDADPHGLQNVGVLQDDAIGSWQERRRDNGYIGTRWLRIYNRVQHCGVCVCVCVFGGWINQHHHSHE